MAGSPPDSPLADGPPDVGGYIEALDPLVRPLFERVLATCRAAAPDADLVISYDMPTLKLGHQRFHIGAWKHGVSLYGWSAAHDSGFVERHPELLHGKGTIRIRPSDAESITDEELADLARAALSS